MAQQQQEERRRGLPSLDESRHQRRRALVLGKVRLREAAPQFWLWTAIFMLGFSVIYWLWSERELTRQKSAVMARQRAIAAELEPRLHPLRDKIEGWVGELAGDWSGRQVDPSLDLGKLSKSKGIYLRLLFDNAQAPEKIRKSASLSLHDGFTSCLFVGNKPGDPSKGTKCHSTAQCQDGELCNEWKVCAAPSQPFNLRLMYQAMRVLSSDWTDELHQATSDYQVRVFERDLDKVARTDVPIGLDLVSNAKYFTALLDEVPEAGVDYGPDGADAGISSRPELRIQGQDHTVRVGVWEVQSGRQLFRGKFQAGADFVPMGRMKTAPQETLDAQQRQVNNCGIAADLRDAVNKAQPTNAQPPGAPTDTAPSDTAQQPAGDAVPAAEAAPSGD